MLLIYLSVEKVDVHLFLSWWIGRSSLISLLVEKVDVR